MTHELLIVSYWRDYPWLAHAIRSLDRFSEGFGVTVVVPNGHAATPTALLGRTRNLPRWQVRTDAEPPGLGQLFSQVTKVSADVFVPPDTKLVTFFDSDCILTGKFTPDMLYKHGKPEMLYRRFEKLYELDLPSKIWHPVIEENLKFSVPVETMCRFPMSYPVELFPEVRAHIEKVQKKRFADYVFGTGKNSWPQKFCESNVLGGYAYVKRPELYTWTDVDAGVHDSMPLRQFFSHGGFNHMVEGRTQRDIITQHIGWE